MSGNWIAWGVVGMSAFFCGCSGSLKDVGDVPGGHAGADASGHAGNNASGHAGTGGHAGGSTAGGAPNAGSVGESPGGEPGTDEPDDGSAGAGQGSSDLVGEWTGYVESFQFRDDSDAVKFSIGPGASEGRVVFGASPDVAPPTDPDATYPVGSERGASSLMSPDRAPYPGFSYTIENLHQDGARLQFDILTSELYRAWCPLQTSYADDTNPGYYACLPNWEDTGGDGTHCHQSDPETGQPVSRSCTQITQCSFGDTCACTAAGCTAPDQYPVHFDVMLASNKADGSIAGLTGEPYRVQLSKSK